MSQEIDDLDINQLTTINQFDLEKEFAETPRYFYLFSTLAVEAEDLLDQHTLIMEIFENKLAKEIKEKDLNRENRKKLSDLTQTDIKRLFHENDEWQKLRKEQLRLQKNLRMMEKAAKAFDMKARMLSSLNRRDLFKSDRGMGQRQQ